LPNQGGRVISIVDDDVSLRRSLRNLLRSEGLRIAEDSALSLQGGRLRAPHAPSSCPPTAAASRSAHRSV